MARDRQSTLLSRRSSAMFFALRSSSLFSRYRNGIAKKTGIMPKYLYPPFSLSQIDSSVDYELGLPGCSDSRRFRHLDGRWREETAATCRATNAIDAGQLRQKHPAYASVWKSSSLSRGKHHWLVNMPDLFTDIHKSLFLKCAYGARNCDAWHASAGEIDTTKNTRTRTTEKERNEEREW